MYMMASGSNGGRACFQALWIPRSTCDDSYGEIISQCLRLYEENILDDLCMFVDK